MPATNLTNLLKVFGENTSNLQDDTTYASSNDRLTGFQPNTIISSRLTNTALRQSTLISSALVQAIKEVSSNLTTAKTIGGATTFTDAVNTLKEAILKIKVNNAALADNVVGGAIVEETTTAREFKPGFGISQNIKRQARLKETWIGTHVNGDMIYYNDTDTIPTLKGWYIVYGLSEEMILSNVFVPAQTLVITSGQTPTTHAANLKRLTIETAIGSNVNLSKTDTISSSSTINQLSSGKAVFDFAQSKIAAGTTNDILTRTGTAGTLGILTKVTSFDSSSTDNQIPTAKAIYDEFENAYQVIASKQDKLPSGTNKIVTLTATQGVTGTLDRVTSISASSTDSQIGTAKAVYTGLETKVDKVANSRLITDTEATKLEGIQAGAQVNNVLKQTGAFGTSGNSGTLSTITRPGFSLYIGVDSPSLPGVNANTMVYDSCQVSITRVDFGEGIKTLTLSVTKNHTGFTITGSWSSNAGSPGEITFFVNSYRVSI